MARFKPLRRDAAFQTAACLAWAITLWQFDGTEEIVLGVKLTNEGGDSEESYTAMVRLDVQHSMKVEDAWEAVSSQIGSPSVPFARETEIQYSSIISFSSRGPQKPFQAKSSVWWDERHIPEVWMSSMDEWKHSRMKARLEYCTNKIRSKPHGPLADVLGASPAELKTIEEWNRSSPTRHDRCIHNLIEERAKEHPDSPAIESWDGTLTYAELDKISSQNARRLISKGIGPEKFVGLYLSKGRWTAVAILSVLKAGGAFILLEQSHPEERLKSMCQAGGVSLILKILDDTSKDFVLPEIPSLELEYEQRTDTLPQSDTTAVESQPTDAAYIAFTSGSTGAPRGAIIQHDMFVSGSLSHGPAYKMTPQSRVFQFSSYAFDGAIMEHLSTLIAGGCVCIPSASEQLNDLPGAISKLRASCICLTPSVLHLLSPSQMPSLKTLIVTGESMSKELVQKWASSTQLIITYGPTECSVAASSTSPVHAGVDPGILGSTHNCRFWVADPDYKEQLVPPGAIGELFIEGPIVGRGYVNAEPDIKEMYGLQRPWLRSIIEPDRTYRTGDLVQYTGTDGSLRYLGRKDSQVKIRGQRIELGEIEHSIRHVLAGVKDLNLAVEAVFLPRNRQSRSLIVFYGTSITSAGEKGALAPLCPQLLQQWNQHVKPLISTKLPSFMIPAMILPLARFPFTLTGKVDRKQLRGLVTELSQETLDSYSGFNRGNVTPASGLGCILQKVIGEVLDIAPEDVCMERSFLELGGDSVDVMRLVSSLREGNVQLSVAEVMSCPSIAALSKQAQWEKRLTSGKRKRVAEPFDLMPVLGGETVPTLLAKYLPRVRMDEVEDVMPATEVQRLFLRGPPEYIMLHLTGPVDHARLENACKAMIRRHSILRTVFFEHKGRTYQVVLQKPHSAFSNRRCGSSIYHFAESLWEEHASDQSEDYLPVTRFFYAAQGPTENFLVLRISHAQYDAESVNYLFKDLFSAYCGKPISDSPLGFGVWMHDFLSHSNAKSRAFWKHFLDGSSMTHIGAPYSPVSTTERQIAIENNTHRATPPVGITMASLVKAAWAMVLAEASGSNDVVFGQWIHCPESQGTGGKTPIVGPCLNAIPVRVKLNVGSTVRQFLAEIQSQNTKTFSHCRLQLGEISQACAWASNTMFGSEILHIGEEHGTKAQLQVDSDLKASVDVFWPRQSPPRLRWLLMASKREGESHSFCMFTTSAYVNETQGRQLVDRWSRMVHLLAENPEAVLQTIRETGDGRN